jgi:hypothetical protein
MVIIAVLLCLPPGVGVCAAASFNGGSARPVRFLADLSRFELF